MEPPPEGDHTFSNAKEATSFVQTWAKQHGYAVSVHACPKQYIYLQCDKGGAPKNCRKLSTDTRQRNTSSARCGCPFMVRLTNRGDGCWNLIVKNGAHNHPASSDIMTHALHRRIDVVTKDEILELAAHNTPPRQIAALLAQREEPIRLLPKDISNLLGQHQNQLRQGRQPVEVLLEWLIEKRWPHQIKKSQAGEGNERVEGLFFAHPVGLQLLRRFGTVAIIDATYNTNKHRFPLLHLVGLTSTNRTFTIALAFLPDETTLSYMWALQAVQQFEPEWKPEVVVTDDDASLGAAMVNVFTHKFSNIHCQWHVRENVKKVARKTLQDDADFEFFMSDFDELRDARTLDQLTEARDQLDARWSHYGHLVDYIDAKLSSEHLWSSVYIDRHPHMGNRVTSRAEGAHATMKAYLHSRNGNLLGVVKALMNHFTTQHLHIKSELAADLNKVPHFALNDRFYINLVRSVSRFALRVIHKEDELASLIMHKLKQNPKDNKALRCDEYCIIQPTMGLPCAHQLAQLRGRGESIPLSIIHSQWRTTSGLPGITPPRLLDPLDPLQRKLAAAITASGRLLTGAELAVLARKRAMRRCRNCHQAGHNSGTCPKPCGRCQSQTHKLNQCTTLS